MAEGSLETSDQWEYCASAQGMKAQDFPRDAQLLM
jgi:hypothetical protein